jgi:ATP-dependent helicase/nuclease subunit A
MSVNWTREQMQVIESRGSNLLVSAAAGSGKTAVLVERIIRMVTEGERPLDIDRLLVMTFTNAAASEMRERISLAVSKKLDEMPGDEHLQMQAALVHHARITTIDSFCLDLIRNHFNLLDLDPSFRIGDEGELTLLRADVMEELLEDYYAEGQDRFVRFVETYARGKGDGGIEDIIMQVYTFSQSNPDPKLWIHQCREEIQAARSEGGEAWGEVCNPADEEEEIFWSDAERMRWEQQPWMNFLMEDLRRQARELAGQMEEALFICREDEILQVYASAFLQDIGQLKSIAQAKNFEELYDRLSGVSWERLPAVRRKDVDGEKKAYVSSCRDRVKKSVAKMQALACFAAPEEMERDMAAVREPVEMLLELAEEFERRYQEKKREKNLVDFNDLEHQALKVLIRYEDGKMVFTEAADELSRQFEEVLVDEYQDSNLVQEALLLAVSQERFGKPNVFMVGDVKQSIYKFRLARPELFLEKYHTYEPYESASGTDKKIELHQNFRSRAQVLWGINDVFYQIMTENLGGIRYTEETALHPGAVFPENQEKAKGESLRDERPVEREKNGMTVQGTGFPELLVMDTGAEAFQDLEEDAADFTARELEAKLIASKIRQIIDPDEGMMVWDKSLNGTGGYRRAQYRDMVILLRSTAGWTENFLSVLMNEGIPACAESRTGYFTTIEVEVILSFLAVIDNPMQDIPLAAVLKSPVAGVTDGELGDLMAYYRSCADKGQDRGIYGAMIRFLEDWEKEEEPAGEEGQKGTKKQLAQKLFCFSRLLYRFRHECTYLPIHELIYRVYEETGYYHYVSAMPAGETRRANLDMLVEKAADYEKTSYKGLFHFIRYIENLKKYHTDFGEASVAGEEEDTVRIISIHKSKGLEFPIVFLAGMGKKFNKQDTYGKILIDPNLGIATEYLDLEHRLKITTLKRNALRRKMELDNLGEELRVLYVAMTRAKERLIMTGTSRYLEKIREKYEQVPLVDGQIPYTILSSAGSYLDWIFMSLGTGKVRIDLRQIPLADMMGEEMIWQAGRLHSREQLLQVESTHVCETEYQKMLNKHLNYKYPYEADIRIHTKMSVSELKKQGQMADEAETSFPILAAQASGQDFGATRGTAYHHALQLLPFSFMESQKDVEDYLSGLVEKGRFAGESLGLIDCGVLWRFLQSGFGQKMSLAEKEGRLYKEKQFVMGIPAREMGAGESDELVVIQGIIDAYMEEEGELVVVDYKTDRVHSVKPLLDRYKQQLEYYGRALEQMTGKKVKERVIYSLEMQREIFV